MPAKFLLVPAALIAASPAMAAEDLTFEEAQQRLVPGATLTPLFFKLNDRMSDLITDSAQVAVWFRDVKVWFVSGGGLLFLDQVRGRDDWITYAVALDDKGAVKGIEILECLPKYDQITLPAWRAQYTGKQFATLDKKDITAISGTTLSSFHITNGVKRILAIYALIMARPKP